MIAVSGLKFCDVATGNLIAPNPYEPKRIAETLSKLNLRYAVITSVDRDDLIDGGAEHWIKTIELIRIQCPEMKIETLIPDFQGIEKHLDKIVDVNPEVVSHNMETVKRLTREVRIQAKYERSLNVLKYLKDNGINRTKSGIMLGLGEKENEVFETLEDLRNKQC